MIDQSNDAISTLINAVAEDANALTGNLSEVILALTSIYSVVAQQAPQFQDTTAVPSTQITTFSGKLSASVGAAVTIIQNVVGDEVAQVSTASSTVLSIYQSLILAGTAVNTADSSSAISNFTDAISGIFFATSGIIKAIHNVAASVAVQGAAANDIEAVNGLAVVLTTILQAVVAGTSKVAKLNTGLSIQVLEMLIIVIAGTKGVLKDVTAIVNQLSDSLSSNGNVLDARVIATALKKINASYSANHPKIVELMAQLQSNANSA